MKKIKFLSVVLTLLVGAYSYAKDYNRGGDKVEIHLVERNNTMSITTEEEYKNASEFEKRIIKQIDATISALRVLNDNTKVGIVSISKNPKNNFSNSIIIANNEAEAVLLSSPKGSCKVCAGKSAYDSLKKLQQINTDELVIQVKIEKSCVELSW